MFNALDVISPGSEEMEEERNALYEHFLETISFDLCNKLGRQAEQAFITLFTTSNYTSKS